RGGGVGRCWGRRESVTGVSFSPDGKVLAVGYQERVIRLWDVATGQERQCLRGHESWVGHVAFSADGRVLASGGEDRTIRLWDVGTGQELRRLQGHEERV